VAAVKGMIFKFHPKAVIVDITHQVQPFDYAEAAYILKNAYSNFPDGTIHIVGINTEESINDAHIVAYYNKHYFIGTDDGIFSLIFDNDPEYIVELNIPLESSIHTFSSRDRFAKAAAHIAQGGKLEELGPIRKELVKKILFNPPINEDSLIGMVIHIDNYHNLILISQKPILRNLFQVQNLRYHSDHKNIKPVKYMSLMVMCALVKLLHYLPAMAYLKLLSIKVKQPHYLGFIKKIRF
jgi:S-adenosylmethionine hydrolase